MNILMSVYAIHYDPWMYIGILSDEHERAKHVCLIFNLIYRLVLVK